MIEFSKFIPPLDYPLEVIQSLRERLFDLPTSLKQADKTTLALGSASLICLLIWLNSGKRRNLPPGPKGWPILGVLPDFGKSLADGTQLEYLASLNDQHGRIMSFKAGVQTFIWITDGKVITELFKKEEFALRPVNTLPVLKKLNGGTQKGIIFSNGQMNTEMRRFALLALRDFGVGKTGLDEIVQTEATDLTRYFEQEAMKNGGIVSNIKPKCQSATANVIHSILFGFRKDYDDPGWASILNALLMFFEINPLGFPENFLPILKYLPPFFSGGKMRKFFEYEDEVRGYVSSQIDEHRSTYYDGEIRDFLDLYIKYEREHREYYTTESIFTTIMDLFRAGTDTTATSLGWAIMYLAKNPDIQKQLNTEIQEIVGDQVFDRKNKDKLVKTRAFINEVHRYVSVAGFTPPHTVSEDTEVSGYTFPKDSLIFGNIFAIHHDKEYWGDPQNFRVDRWIGAKGELLQHGDHFLPFSNGKRACPGKQIAGIELIIFLVEMIQNFTFEVPQGFTDMEDQQKPGLIRSPKNFHVKITRRT